MAAGIVKRHSKLCRAAKVAGAATASASYEAWVYSPRDRQEDPPHVLELRGGALLASRCQAPDRPRLPTCPEPADASRGGHGLARRRGKGRGPKPLRRPVQAVDAARLPPGARGADPAADRRREAERDHDLRPAAAGRPLARRGPVGGDPAQHDQAAAGDLPAREVARRPARQPDAGPGAAGAAGAQGRDRRARGRGESCSRRCRSPIRRCGGRPFTPAFATASSGRCAGARSTSSPAPSPFASPGIRRPGSIDPKTRTSMRSVPMPDSLRRAAARSPAGRAERAGERARLRSLGRSEPFHAATLYRRADSRLERGRARRSGCACTRRGTRTPRS